MDFKSNGLLTMENLMENIERVKYSPSAITRAVLEHVDSVSSGKVNIVDITNPFMLLMSSGAAFCSSAIHETTDAVRNIYPTLTTAAKQIYRHMTDKEFVNAFAVPGSAKWTVYMSREDVLNKMVYDSSEKSYKAVFPRDTLFKVLETPYTLEYPIVIRLADNGTFKIEYDTEIASPVASLKTNIIEYRTSRSIDANGTQVGWIAFEIPLRQFDVVSQTYTIEKSIPLKKILSFPDKYYMSRVYYRNNNTDGWKEIAVTHGDYVYDGSVVTAQLDVIENDITLALPHAYVMAGMISGEIRHDVFYTKGEINENYANLGLDSFSISRRAIDEERDISEFTNILDDINHYAIASKVGTGGRDSLTIDELRSRVINHTTGPNEFPITPVQFAAKTEDFGFDLVRNIDTLTNRVYYATRKLPKPTSDRLVASANIGINTYIPDLTVLDTSLYVRKNGLRRTITDRALYVNENGIVRMLTWTEVEKLRQLRPVNLVAEINSKQYLYSPYHYVLDDTGLVFDARVYDLTAPVLSDLNFKEQNETMNMSVNTQTYEITKTEDGYKLLFVTRSGDYYKNADQLGMTQCQIGFYPSGDSAMAFINAYKAGSNDAGETIWAVDLKTDLEIDGDNRLKITNAQIGSSPALDVWIDLKSTIHIFHCSNSVTVDYRPSDSDLLINTSMLPDNSKALTHEELTVYIGVALLHLWKRSAALPTGQSYLMHQDSIPARYETDIYEINPETNGEIFIENGEAVRRKLHSAGDIRYNGAGEIIYKYIKGTPVLDENNEPVLSGVEMANREIDMLFVDGRYYFASDKAFTEYKTELVNVLTTWITENIEALNEIALENTKVFFYPKTTLGNVKVSTEDDGADILPSEQSLTIDLYVPKRVYDDNELRAKFITKAVLVLDEYIAKTTVNVTEIQKALFDVYEGSVPTLSVSGLGGSKNYKILTLAAEENRMCLKKILKVQQDNSLIVGEDVTVNFFKIKS